MRTTPTLPAGLSVLAAAPVTLTACSADAVYAPLSDRCRKEWTWPVFEAGVDRATQTAVQLGRSYTLQRPSLDDVHTDTARVTFGVGERQYDETSSWVQEDGERHNDLCRPGTVRRAPRPAARPTLAGTVRERNGRP
ncbi:hypothetical protein [Streptomyces sp. NPDC102409]|uniref:hypothetical protein n=1 Tax=Streptomyces sp. NPDC102409 TaxID=3366172 RepID=UPI0037F2CDF5